MGLCSVQCILRGLITVSAAVLLCLGAVLTTVGLAGLFGMMQLELERAADLLKVPPQVTQVNLTWLFRVVALVGYATVVVGAVAICAASGHRRIHSISAAAGAAAAAVAYLLLLATRLRPRIGAIGKALDKSLVRYFQAFLSTRDEKFLSQIHLQSGCCGLNEGPADFATWGLPLPSSCCGQFSGSCDESAARQLPCRAAIKKLRGDDGLFDLGYLTWLFGINCAVLACLLAVLLVVSGGDSIEALTKMRRKTLERWNRLRSAEEGGDSGGGKRSQRSRKGKSKLRERDRQLAEAFEKTFERSTKASGAKGAEKALVAAGAGGGTPGQQDLELELRKKIERELEAETARVRERKK